MPLLIHGWHHLKNADRLKIFTNGSAWLINNQRVSFLLRHIFDDIDSSFVKNTL